MAPSLHRLHINLENISIWSTYLIHPKAIFIFIYKGYFSPVLSRSTKRDLFPDSISSHRWMPERNWEMTPEKINSSSIILFCRLKKLLVGKAFSCKNISSWMISRFLVNWVVYMGLSAQGIEQRWANPAVNLYIRVETRFLMFFL